MITDRYGDPEILQERGNVILNISTLAADSLCISVGKEMGYAAGNHWNNYYIEPEDITSAEEIVTFVQGWIDRQKRVRETLAQK